MPLRQGIFGENAHSDSIIDLHQSFQKLFEVMEQHQVPQSQIDFEAANIFIENKIKDGEETDSE